jgi:hypothetical protein
MIDMLGDKLRDSHWTVVYKSLICIHTLMRDGSSENVFNYLTQCHAFLNVTGFRPKPNSSGILFSHSLYKIALTYYFRYAPI